MASASVSSPVVAPSARDVVANYVLGRIASAFIGGDFKKADSMSRLHAVLTEMSDQEYMETV